ncbi:endoglucanase [Hathewaya proteolytica DSM 3090]|uniref:Endoglucanase n=1 Tax=Hathewaya proteolytica DSM 3090 TaxID=1121331 RepID=A0A1M6QNK3_9CLOT|nr:M42 family metallopeptidase [Hathewaya proteolytica]SHK21670.1 endoglucanase [Hathewaya proteolytica DSM 3090]
MLLEELCNAHGPVGYEGQVRNIIKKEIAPYVDEIEINTMGNVLVHKKGTGPKVMIDAHMDEVGFIIEGYNEDGTLRFSPLGGVNAKIPPCKVVYIGPEKIVGVIGLKPIHLQSKKEREESLTYRDYCIDIGLESKEETKKMISRGEYVVFSTECGDFGDGLLKGKAFDDRMGCMVLMEVLKEKYDCDLYASFSVQEEIGDRGALPSCFKVEPDIMVAVEGTICADMPSVPKHLQATEIGKGPAISMMDATSIFDYELTNSIIKTAKENNIPYQRRKAIAGGNDAGAAVGTKSGARVATVSVPCRYIHSAISVASKDDLKNTIALMKAWLKTL